jgi:hypothetical protein
MLARGASSLSSPSSAATAQSSEPLTSGEPVTPSFSSSLPLSDRMAKLGETVLYLTKLFPFLSLRSSESPSSSAQRTTPNNNSDDNNNNDNNSSDSANNHNVNIQPHPPSLSSILPPTNMNLKMTDILTDMNQILFYFGPFAYTFFNRTLQNDAAQMYPSLLDRMLGLGYAQSSAQKEANSKPSTSKQASETASSTTVAPQESDDGDDAPLRELAIILGLTVAVSLSRNLYERGMGYLVRREATRRIERRKAVRSRRASTQSGNVGSIDIGGDGSGDAWKPIGWRSIDERCPCSQPPPVDEDEKDRDSYTIGGDDEDDDPIPRKFERLVDPLSSSSSGNNLSTSSSCGICFTSPIVQNPSIIVTCGHTFCWSCIQMWILERENIKKMKSSRGRTRRPSRRVLQYEDEQSDVNSPGLYIEDDGDESDDQEDGIRGEGDLGRGGYCPICRKCDVGPGDVLVLENH